MRRAPEPILDVRAGEARPALGSFFLLALLIGGHTMLETARDALFLGKLPVSRLSLVYGLIAVLALAIAGPNARFVRRFGESRALVMTLLFAAYGTTLLYLQKPAPIVLFAIYVWSAFLGTVMVVQFWMFLARVFTPSQGKRLFGPIAAGGVAGAIAGAASAAAALSIFPVRDLLMGAVLAFVTAALLSTAIEPRAARAEAQGLGDHAGSSPFSHENAHEYEIGPSGANGVNGSRDSHPPSERGREQRLAVLLRTPYLGWLAVLTGVSTAAVLGVDYLFKAEAARYVAAEDLGPYFARSYAAFNAVALVVQVVIAGPLVQRAGVARALLVMPILLLAGSGAAILTGGAHAAILITKGVDGALRHSLHRLTLELLGLQVPASLRPRVKPAIEGALPRIVQATMAGVLFALAATEISSMRAIAAIIMGLSVIWIAAAVAIRRHHLDMFRQALSKGTLSREKALRLDAALVWAVVEELSSPEPERVLAAMEVLADDKQHAAIPGTVLEHPSDRVKVRALALMAEVRRADWTERAEHLIRSGSAEEVRVAAVRALASVHALAEVQKCLADESPAVRAHAAVALSAASESDSAPLPLIADILETPGERGRTGRLALVDAIRDAAHPGFAPALLAIARSTDAEDVELLDHTMCAMERMPDPQFIPVLIDRLHVRSSREAVRNTLVKLGAPAQKAVEQAMRNAATPSRIRLHIPRTLSRFGNQRAADFLTEQLAVEPSGLIRYKALRGLGQLVSTADVRVDRSAIFARASETLISHLTTLAYRVELERAQTKEHPGGRLVLGLLSDKLNQSLDRAFRLLQIAYHREDLKKAREALSSDDPRGRSNALEFLDALTAGIHGAKIREVRELLKLVVDDLPPAEKVERAAKYLKDVPASAEAALFRLAQESDASLSALSVFHAGELGLTQIVEGAAMAKRDRPSFEEIHGALLGERTVAPEAGH